MLDFAHEDRVAELHKEQSSLRKAMGVSQRWFVSGEYGLLHSGHRALVHAMRWS